MHYHNAKWMHILNAALEMLLLVGGFWLAGVLRVVILLGKTFSMADILRYMPVALLYSFTLVAVYALEGCYGSLHNYGGVKKMVAKLAVTNMVGFAFMATFCYVFRLSQLSRLLLGYFYIISVAAITAKRILFEHLAAEYVRRHDTLTRVLILGSGRMAQRFYHDALLKNTNSMRYVGYAAEGDNGALPNYRGREEELHDILARERVDMIVIAQECQDAESLRKLAVLGESYHIRICVIPPYNDLIAPRAERSSLAGMQMVDLKPMNTCEIMGVNIIVTDMAKTLELIRTRLQDWRGKYICVANVHTTVTAHEDNEYRSIQNSAVMALPDGGPLSQYSRDHGYADAARVTGPDLMREILAQSGEYGWRHYFYGSTQETLDKLGTKLKENYPDAIVAGMYSPPFRDLTPQEDAQIVAKINAAKPDFVWVGLGAPKQERWMAAHEDRVNALMIGVGAAFDYEAGNIRRAPAWMQKHNLEWLYRLLQDPKRLFKRYLDTNVKYMLWVYRHGDDTQGK